MPLEQVDTTDTQQQQLDRVDNSGRHPTPRALSVLPYLHSYIAAAWLTPLSSTSDRRLPLAPAPDSVMGMNAPAWVQVGGREAGLGSLQALTFSPAGEKGPSAPVLLSLSNPALSSEALLEEAPQEDILGVCTLPNRWSVWST
jgi:hypothetical protein